MRLPDHESAVAAVRAHPLIPIFRNGPFADVWSDEAIHQHPTIVLECEHGLVIDALPEAWAYAQKHRNRLGQVLRARVLRPDDPLHPTRLVYVLLPSSPAYQRFVKRREARDGAQPLLPIEETEGEQPVVPNRRVRKRR